MKLSTEAGIDLTAAVNRVNLVLRELHLAGHDYGVAVLGREPTPPAIMPDARPLALRMTPPRVYVKIVTEATEVGREPVR